MSMRENPASGYVLPVECLFDKLPGLQQIMENDHEETLNANEIADWLDTHWPKDWPQFENVYQPTPEDTVDNDTMLQGEYYVVFDTDALYMLMPRPQLINLPQIPTHCRWSVWG